MHRHWRGFVVLSLLGASFLAWGVVLHRECWLDDSVRPIMALQGGDRRHASGTVRWATRPPVSRAQAMFHTDDYAVYTGGMPAGQH